MKALLFVALLAHAVAFQPAQAGDASLNLATIKKAAELETAFWACDYAGTNGMVGADQAAACIAITDELKRSKFDGDFDRLVAWWRQNKIAQHQALERVSNAATERRHVRGAN